MVGLLAVGFGGVTVLGVVAVALAAIVVGVVLPVGAKVTLVRGALVFGVVGVRLLFPCNRLYISRLRCDGVDRHSFRLWPVRLHP